jgi:hypothetical protein
MRVGNPPCPWRCLGDIAAASPNANPIHRCINTPDHGRTSSCALCLSSVPKSTVDLYPSRSFASNVSSLRPRRPPRRRRPCAPSPTLYNVVPETLTASCSRRIRAGRHVPLDPRLRPAAAQRQPPRHRRRRRHDLPPRPRHRHRHEPGRLLPRHRCARAPLLPNPPTHIR